MKTIFKFIKDNILFILAILYFFWPADLIPEVFALFGGPVVLLDDGGMLLIAIIQKIYSHFKNRNKPEETTQTEVKS